jgi:hypothetical protein
MTKNQRHEEIMNRYYGVLAEKSLQEKGSEHYQILSKIAKLILSELTNGNHPKHIMYMVGNRYEYRCEWGLN